METAAVGLSWALEGGRAEPGNFLGGQVFPLLQGSGAVLFVTGLGQRETVGLGHLQLEGLLVW